MASASFGTHLQPPLVLLHRHLPQLIAHGAAPLRGVRGPLLRPCPPAAPAAACNPLELLELRFGSGCIRMESAVISRRNRDAEYEVLQRV